MNNYPNNPTQPPPTREAEKGSPLDLAHESVVNLLIESGVKMLGMTELTDKLFQLIGPAYADHLESENTRLREELRGMEVRALEAEYDAYIRTGEDRTLPELTKITARFDALREQGEGA